jgi:hypothetical protein
MMTDSDGDDDGKRRVTHLRGDMAAGVTDTGRSGSILDLTLV